MTERVIRPVYREEKRDIPYGELEHLLISLGEKTNLQRYTDLPPTLTSTEIETYANWLTKISQQSPLYGELGAYVHIRRNSPTKIVIPTRPDVGKDGITPAFARKRTTASPVALIHNHPINSCFSQPRGHDMESFVNGYYDQDDHIQVPVWVLTTPDDNYLLIRTQETTQTDGWQLYNISYNAVDRSKYLNFRRFGTQTGRSLNQQHFWEVFDLAEKQYFGGEGVFELFYASFFGTFNIAQECKFGFYHSHKDGQYRRVTQKSLEDLLTLRYEQALNNARSILRF